MLRQSGWPRGNPDFPKIGILARRKKERPNRLELWAERLISCQGRSITVKYIDAIDGTPPLDIKPLSREFQPRGSLGQPK
jgi:tRNA (adenine37-N6)-methyltransferase